MAPKCIFSYILCILAVAKSCFQALAMLGRKADWFVSEKVTKAHNLLDKLSNFLDKCWRNFSSISPGYVMIFDEINRVCL